MDYPMDFYSNTSLGSWTVNNELNRNVPVSRRRNKVKTEKLRPKNTGSKVESKDSCEGQRTERCGKCHPENVLNKNETSQ